MSIGANVKFVLGLAVVATGIVGCSGNVHQSAFLLPEQQSIAWRSPESLSPTPIQSFTPPRTVSNPDNGLEPLNLSLDEAIRIALSHSEVVRVLTGFSASSSGSTIYDVGIANTSIDQAQSRFDPVLSINNSFSDDESGQGVFTGAPPGAAIVGSESDAYLLDSSLSKTNLLGGVSALRFGVSRFELEPGQFPLDPQTSHFTELSYVQPLLQGAGFAANEAPILVARLETERSFFQFKGSVQQLVLGVIDAYWALVLARTERVARQQQVNQSKFAFDRQAARIKRGIGKLEEVSQSKSLWKSFEASLVTADSNVLQREAALLNILGLSPTEVGEVIPITPAHEDRIDFEWQELVGLAERYRPDLVELKLIIDADRQRALLARNNARPQLDASARYRWDGLRGRTPGGSIIATDANELMDWTIGVNFSVPIGLRQARAEVRQQELLILRDQANLNQGLHNAVHQLALTVRSLDQSYEQYLKFRESRDASAENLKAQRAKVFAQTESAPFLNLLQAITDWGNSISSEAQALTAYNSELASLELQTGTILETHGIRFMEERYAFAGPRYCLREQECYPGAVYSTENAPKYEVGDEPAENAFDIRDQLEEYRRIRERLDTPTLEDLGFRPETLPGTQQQGGSLRNVARFDEFLPEKDHERRKREPVATQASPNARQDPHGPILPSSKSNRRPTVSDSAVSAHFETTNGARHQLLVPQRFDRIKPTRLTGGIEPEENSHSRRK